MASCCDPRGCDELFTPGFARRMARRYRRRGLDRAARRMVAFLEQRGIRGATVLEIGGGVGEIQIELLKRGAAHTVNLELSPGYEAEASQLFRDAGLAGRTDRRVHDIAVDPDAVERADVVVLHRVVCCYPDYQRLLAAAGDHARRLLVFSHPPHLAVVRLAAAAQNAVFRLLRREYRAFIHAPDAMLAVLAERGLRATYASRGPIWQVVGLER